MHSYSQAGLLIGAAVLATTTTQVLSFSTAVPLHRTTAAAAAATSRINLRPSDAEDLVAAFDAICAEDNKSEDDESNFDLEGFVKEPEDEESSSSINEDDDDHDGFLAVSLFEEKPTTAVTAARSFATKLFSLPNDIIERNWYPDNYDEEFNLNYRSGVELLYGTTFSESSTGS